MISEEVKMIQRDHPSPSFAEPDTNTLRPEGAGKTVDPEAAGTNVGPGPMGSEATAGTREEPVGQGMEGEASPDDNVAEDTKMARGAITPHDAVEEPAEVGAGVLATDGQSEKSTQPPKDEAEEEELRSNDGTNAQQSIPATREPALRDNLLYNRKNISTIAASNFSGVIEDRVATLTEQGQQPDSRDAQHLASKLMQGQLIRFESKAEKVAVQEAAKKLAEKRARQYARRKGLSSDEVQPQPINYEFAPIPEAVQKKLIDSMVAGKYDADGLLQQGKEKHKQPVLNEIAKMTMKNGTYLGAESDRFLWKVRSLLPAATATRHGGAAQKQKAK